MFLDPSPAVDLFWLNGFCRYPRTIIPNYYLNWIKTLQVTDSDTLHYHRHFCQAFGKYIHFFDFSYNMVLCILSSIVSFISLELSSCVKIYLFLLFFCIFSSDDIHFSRGLANRMVLGILVTVKQCFKIWVVALINIVWGFLRKSYSMPSSSRLSASL